VFQPGPLVWLKICEHNRKPPSFDWVVGRRQRFALSPPKERGSLPRHRGYRHPRVEDPHGAYEHGVAADLARHRVVAHALVLGNGAGDHARVEVNPTLRQITVHRAARVRVHSDVAVLEHVGEPFRDGMNRTASITAEVLPGGDARELVPGLERHRRHKGPGGRWRGRHVCRRYRLRVDKPREAETEGENESDDGFEKVGELGEHGDSFQVCHF